MMASNLCTVPPVFRPPFAASYSPNVASAAIPAYLTWDEPL